MVGEADDNAVNRASPQLFPDLVRLAQVHGAGRAVPEPQRLSGRRRRRVEGVERLRHRRVLLPIAERLRR